MYPNLWINVVPKKHLHKQNYLLRDNLPWYKKVVSVKKKEHFGFTKMELSVSVLLCIDDKMKILKAHEKCQKKKKIVSACRRYKITSSFVWRFFLALIEVISII